MKHSPLADLPSWVLDLVIALEEHSDTHPKYYAEYHSSNYVMRPAYTCGCEPLEVIPADVRQMIRDHAVSRTRIEADASP